MQSSHDDEATKGLLEELLKACLDVMDRQLESQLPGGKFWNPTPELRQVAASCPTTNISGERNFATADQELHRARHGKAGFIEGKVMYRVNKTGTWLGSMTYEEKVHHIDLARRSARVVVQEELADEKEHQRKLSEQLVETRKKILQKEDRDRSKVENWLNDVYCSGGLWTSEVMMNENLQGLSKTKTVQFLKSQLQTRTKILKSDLLVQVVSNF